MKVYFLVVRSLKSLWKIDYEIWLIRIKLIYKKNIKLRRFRRRFKLIYLFAYINMFIIPITINNIIILSIINIIYKQIFISIAE